jgi:hypothetical protein
VHDYGAVTVTSSKPANDERAAKNAADLAEKSFFCSAYRDRDEDIPKTDNNWICYDFQHRLITPNHYLIRPKWNGGTNGPNLRTWRLEGSRDGENWHTIHSPAKEEMWALVNNNVTRVFGVTAAGQCRFVRLVNIGRNH